MNGWSGWTLAEFTTTSGRGVITELRNGRSEKEKATMDATLRWFKVTQAQYLGPPKFKKVTSCGEIYRLRFRVKRVQFRILGFWGPDPHMFTMVVPFTKQTGKTAYRGPCGVALRRKKQVETERCFREYRV